MSKFVHLHTHTEYSLLDGMSRIDQLIETAKEKNMDSIAITDHGVMFGVVQFYKKCKEAGIKPIIGCEVYIAENSYLDRNSQDSNYHLVLLAENNTGYHNLMKIVSEAFIHGFYYKPRVDKDILRQYSEGIIATSACLGGEIQQDLVMEDYEKAKKDALTYRDIFGQDNFFLELQDHGLSEQKLVNQGLINLSKETGIELIASNDLHYINKEDAKIQDIVLCIQTGKIVSDENRMKFPTDEFYLKSYEEMRELFPDQERALENTVKIAERCNVDLDFSTLHLPHFEAPEGYTNEEYLRELTYQGLEKRYEMTDLVRERADHELSTISQMGYVDYFLIVWDFINFAHKNSIPVGPGRGSAAGSIISYALGITKIDPLKYDLLFERFLNPERVSMPDIDIDFCYERRGEVIDYVIEKYGENNVAQIVTFGTMQARGAIRDVGRVLDVPYNEVDRIAKMIPIELGMTIDKALEVNRDLADEYETNFLVKKLIDYSRAIENMPRHTSTHAAGVVITENPVTDYVPLSRNDDVLTTQYNMTELEELGLLKMDFLGLRTLTVISDSLKSIKRDTGKDIDIDGIDFNDPEVLKLFSTAHTLGVFQFESAGMRAFLKNLKPSRFDDLVAANSLFRPGPMDQIPTYIHNKYYPEDTKYIHPALEPILNVTYGTIVYQEQVMQIVQKLAGYSLGEADLLRRAMSKKKMDVMEKERKRFIHGQVDDEGNILVDGCIRRGVDEDSANKIYDLMIDFAKYAFNKSHSVAYAYVAMQTAWLKKYYPNEFMAALMSSVMDTKDKIALYIHECKRLNLDILPPSINKSFDDFSVEDGKIRFGLAAVKNVGKGLVEGITKEREKNGPYRSFTEFVKRASKAGIQINKKAIECLIKVGAFADTGINRASLISNFEKIIDSVQKNSRSNVDGQMSMLEGIREDEPDEKQLVPEYSEDQILQMEKELTGLYISGHPLSEYSQAIDKISTFTTSLLSDEEDLGEIQRKFDGKYAKVLGLVVARRDLLTKNNDPMSFVQLEDEYGDLDIVVFPKTFAKYRDILGEDQVLVIEGKLSIGDDKKVQVIADKIYEAEKNSKTLYVQLESANTDTSELKACLNKCPGPSRIVVWFKREKRGGYFKDSRGVKISKNLVNQLKDICGSENIIVK